MTKKNLYQKIKAAFFVFHPEKIIIFGSWAREDNDLYSDIDVIVVLKSNKRFLDRLADLYEKWPLDKSADILAYTPEEFSQMLADENPFLVNALKEGIIIYERSKKRGKTMV